MAERQGFEPWVPFIAGHSLSRRAPSAYSVTSPVDTVYFFDHEKSIQTVLKASDGKQYLNYISEVPESTFGMIMDFYVVTNVFCCKQ